MNVRILIVAAVLIAGCKERPPETSGDASPAVEPAPETTVSVEVAGDADASPALRFRWPRDGRLGVRVTQTVERTGLAVDAGQSSESVEEDAWTWTLAGTDDVLRLGSSSPARPLTVDGDGRVAGGGDAEAALWARMVGHWVGRDATPGAVFEGPGVLHVRGFDGATVSATLRSAVVGRVPCKDRSRDLRCLAVEVRAEPDADGKEALLAELRGKGDPARSLRDVEVTEHVRLRTVPSSLQPAALTVERITRLRFRTPDGAEATERTREVREYAFDWAR